MNLDVAELGASLLPVIAKTLEKAHADEFVYEHLPEHIKETATLEEFKAAEASGALFLKDLAALGVK